MFTASIDLIKAVLQGYLEPEHLGLPETICARHKHAKEAASADGHGDTEEEARYELQALRLELTDKVHLWAFARHSSESVL